jgi:hypothetical protein
MKASDLNDQPVLFTMSHVILEEVGDDSRPVLYFQGKEKGLVLNKTNSNNIAFLYGDDTDGWGGKPLVLFPAMVDYQGQTKPAIRVRAPKKGAATPAPAAAPKVAPPMDDEIPF